LKTSRPDIERAALDAQLFFVRLGALSLESLQSLTLIFQLVTFLEFFKVVCTDLKKKGKYRKSCSDQIPVQKGLNTEANS
jgi:hypothetical protein